MLHHIDSISCDVPIYCFLNVDCITIRFFLPVWLVPSYLQSRKSYPIKLIFTQRVMYQ